MPSMSSLCRHVWACVRVVRDVCLRWCQSPRTRNVPGLQYADLDCGCAAGESKCFLESYSFLFLSLNRMLKVIPLHLIKVQQYELNFFFISLGSWRAGDSCCYQVCWQYTERLCYITLNHSFHINFIFLARRLRTNQVSKTGHKNISCADFRVELYWTEIFFSVQCVFHGRGIGDSGDVSLWLRGQAGGQPKQSVNERVDERSGESGAEQKDKMSGRTQKRRRWELKNRLIQGWINRLGHCCAVLSWNTLKAR